MFPLDYAEYKPWKTLNQGDLPHCQAYAFFGLLMECIEQKYHLKVEFDVQNFFEIIRDLFKKVPKNSPTAKPRQWYFYDYGMRYGYRTKTGEKVTIHGYRHLTHDVDLHNFNLITQLLQSSPMQVGVDTFKNYKLNIDADILPTFPTKPILDGGHELFLIGFDKQKKRLLFQNSWGDEYPPKWLPFDSFKKMIKHAFTINDITITR